MPSLFTEDTYEQAIIELFQNKGYDHLYAPDMERDYSSPLVHCWMLFLETAWCVLTLVCL